MSEQNELPVAPEPPELDAANLLAPPTAGASRVRRVDLPERGGYVHVRMLCGTERDAYEAGLQRVTKDGVVVPNLDNGRARFAALVLCDASGKRLFGDRDAAALGARLDSASLDRVFEAGRDFNRMTKAAGEDARGN